MPPVSFKHKRRSITDRDLFRIKLISTVSMSPSERYIAYTVERIEPQENRYVANLFVYDSAEDRSTQYTFGPHYDSRIAWSPDASTIAFVSTRNRKTGIYIIPVKGGAERSVFEAEATIGELLWTPDGKHLVFDLRYHDSHFVNDEQKKNDEPVCRHITRLYYRMEGVGFRPKDPWQIYRLDVASGKLQKITTGNRDCQCPTLSPDGRWVAFLSNCSKDPDLECFRQDLFVISLQGGRPHLIAAPPGPKASLKFSPNGKLIAYIGHDNLHDPCGAINQHIWVAEIGGKPKAHDVMPSFDRSARDLSLTDLANVQLRSPLFWSADGRRLYYLCSNTGVTNLYSMSILDGKPVKIFAGKCHIKDFSVSGKCRMVALIYADLATPSELLLCPTKFGGEREAKKLTDVNAFLRTDIKIGRTRDVTFHSSDGTKIQGFLLTPPNFSPRRNYPAILEIHGGPRLQYAYTFFHEMQFLAAQGYVVFYSNPRGSAGRGFTWADTISSCWADFAYQDLMAAADYLEKQRFIDGKRIGVTGGLYGGYMTNWIIGHTDRFRAAVTQRGIVDFASMVGTSDVGYIWADVLGGYPWDMPEEYAKWSPITYFRNVKTPVLILHNEQDFSSRIDGAERMYVMLKILGKTVEFVRFPGESHGLSRHGRPDRRIARLNWILKWFDKYLK